MTDAEIKLPGNTLNVLRRIRRCEGDVSAQVVLEHFMRQFARSIRADTLEEAAKICEDEGFKLQLLYDDPISITTHCAQAIRSLGDVKEVK